MPCLPCQILPLPAGPIQGIHAMSLLASPALANSEQAPRSVFLRAMLADSNAKSGDIEKVCKLFNCNDSGIVAHTEGCPPNDELSAETDIRDTHSDTNHVASH
jgi:hypothetical protein